MNIQEIKAKISQERGFVLGTLSPKQQFDVVKDDKGAEVEVPNEWGSHWEDTHRVRVTFHKDIIAAMLDNPAKADLAVKYTHKPATADRAEYHLYVVITPRDILATF